MSESIYKQWYVLTSKPREEQRAFDNLKSQGYEVFLPKVSKVKKRQGSKTVSMEPLFPSYLFIHLDNSTANFNAIRSTRGIGSFVRFGMKHAVISDHIVEKIQTDMQQTQDAKKTLAQLLNYQAGDKVNINEGPFKGLQAIYKAKDGLERSVLMIKLLGQENEVSVENDLIDKEADSK